MRHITIILISFLLLSPCFAKDSAYTKPNEKLVFGFHTKKGKILAVSMDKDEKYIVYRYGKRKHVELEFPGNKADAYKLFTYSYYMRPGGVENAGMDLNWLRFQNGDFLFVVYDEYVAEGSNKRVGIKLINQETGKTYDIKGDVNTRKGSLVDFRFMDKVQKDSYEPH